MDLRSLFRLVLLLVVWIICLCCTNRGAVLKQNSISVMNLDQAQQRDTLRLSRIFKRVRIVQLDSCQKALIGDISRILTTDEYIFILDKLKSRTLFMFDKQGKLIRTIGRSGNGKGEYVSPSDFALDKSGHRIFVLDRQVRRVLEYDYTTGAYIGFLEIPQLSNHLLYESGFLYMDCLERGGKHLLWRTSTDGQYSEYFFSPVIQNKGWDFILTNQDGIFLSKNSDSPKVTHLFMDTVYVIHNKTVCPYLALYSKDMITEEDLKGLDVDRDIMDLMKLMKKNKYYGLQTYVETNDFILFQLQKQLAFPLFYYDKARGQLYNYRVLYEDMFSGGQELRRLGLRFGCSDGCGACFFLSPSRVDMLKEIKGNTFCSNDEESFNGIVFCYEYEE